MSWYRSGTISLVNGSTAVTGASTDFIGGAAVGEGLLAPDGKVYEIAAVVSATSLTLGSAYLGSNASGQSYAIIPSQSYIRDLASQAATLVNSYQAVKDGIGAGKFPEGTSAAPSISFASDVDTGINHASGVANTMTLSAGGVTQATVNTSGVDLKAGSTVGTVPIAGTTTTQTLTNKTINLTSNTLVATSAQLAAALTDETGTGSAVFATSPTLVTPSLGTPASGTLDNCTTNTEAAGSNSTQLASTAHVFAERTNTATLTNKTLVSPVITTPTLSTEVLPVTTNNYPTVRPSLNLDFANSQTVDSRISFTRSSTATRVNSKGLIETVASGVPRIDFDPVTLECKGLLIEEARTNLLTYSENFDNAAWMKLRASITPNATTSPDGTVTSDKLVEDTTASTDHEVVGVATVVSGNVYTYSIFAKAGERSIFLTTLSGVFTSAQTIAFTLAGNGTATVLGGTSTGTITALGNGWYRCTVTSIAAPSSGTATVYTYLATAATIPGISYTGDGTSGLYIWGAQLEAGAFPTTYLPSTTAAVTRTADVAVMTGANFSSWYRQDESTLVVGWNATANTSDTNHIAMVAKYGTSEAVSLRIGYSGVRKARYFSHDVAGTFQYAIDGDALGTATSGAFALAFRPSNDFYASTNGAAVGGDTSGAIAPSTHDILTIGSAGIFYANACIKYLRYYPSRVSNAALQALSTN